MIAWTAGARVTVLLFSLFLSTFAVSAIVPPAPQPERPACAEWQACRDQADQARAAGDYERFHDLAWRAVQTRGRRDPDLLFLLARAQSLSGRPHDALVTLQRLAIEQGVGRDVSADEDFRRVRSLPGWADVEALILRTGEAATAAAAPAPPTTTTEAAAIAAPPAPALRPVDAIEVARFSTPPFEPGGLAYDAVSRRFVIGNLPERKLTIVAEGTNRAATLSGDAANLLNVAAIEIDRAQGDLWVASAARDAGGRGTSQVTKLQLISGRRLQVFTPDPEQAPSRFVDLALNHGNGVLVLDAEGPRLFQITKAAQALTVACELPAGSVASLAPGAPGIVYVAYGDKLVRADLRARTAAKVHAAGGSEIPGLRRIRWHEGSLIALQRIDGGGTRMVRLRLARAGTRVGAIETLQPAQQDGGTAAALDLLGDSLFYLVSGPDGSAIRRIDLK